MMWCGVCGVGLLGLRAIGMTRFVVSYSAGEHAEPTCPEPAPVGDLELLESRVCVLDTDVRPSAIVVLSYFPGVGRRDSPAGSGATERALGLSLRRLYEERARAPIGRSK